MFVTSLLVALSFVQAPATSQAGHISGRITAQSTNTPIADAQVTLIPQTRPAGPAGLPPQAFTDRDGRFQFDDVTPGTYRISVQKSGFAPDEWFPGQPPSQQVRVAPGQSVSGIDRQLQKGAVIGGRILDANGEPMPDVPIMVMRHVAIGRGTSSRLIPAPGQGRQTNDLGEFRMSGLAAGEYYVAAMPNPMRSGGSRSATADGSRTTLARTFYPGTTDEAAALPVAVTAGAEVGNISFTLQSAAAFRVSGIVVDEDGNTVNNAMVMLSGDGLSGNFGPGRNARTQPDGRFVIVDVPAGSYRVHAMPILTGNGSGGSGGVVSFSSSSSAGAAAPPPPIVVTDADVTGLTVVTPRPTRQ
jgi:protocatechuate 3,4-dioxygenase beta subunit